MKDIEDKKVSTSTLHRDEVIEQLMEQISRRDMRLKWYQSEYGRFKHTAEQALVAEKILAAEKAKSEQALAAEKAKSEQALAAEKAKSEQALAGKALFKKLIMETVREEMQVLRPDGKPLQSKRFSWGSFSPRNLLVRAFQFLRTRNRGFLMRPPAVFWSGWYLFQNPDVHKTRQDPFLHYLSHGWKERRSPHPFFDGDYYLKTYPDVAVSGINPLVHYVLHGWREGRNPSPFFEGAQYLLDNPDVAAVHADPLRHFFFYGFREGRQPKRSFSARAFFDAYPHYKKAGWSSHPFMKWLQIREMEEYFTAPLANIGGEPQHNQESKPHAPSLSFNRHKILFIGHDGFRAGAEMVLLRLLRWFRKHTNLELYVVLLAGGVLTTEFEAVTPTLILNKYTGKTDEELHSILKDFCGGEPDLVYCNTLVVANHVELLSQFKSPVVFHVHELENIIKRMVDSVKLARLKNVVSRVIAVSPPVEQNLIENHGIRKDIVDLIFPFIDSQPISEDEDKGSVRKRLGLREEGIIVFGCGTVDHRKGVDIFVKTVEELKGKGFNNFHFYWIGNRMPGAENLIGDLAARKLDKNVTFLGEKENPREYFAGGDAFLLPSREDPFPLVCLEAAECGLPVICFDEAGGMPGFVEDDAGFVIPYLDQSALTEKTAVLIENESLRLELGSRAREKLLQRHTADIVAPRILSLIRETANIKPAVSVIVPCYNHAEFLPKRLDAIFNQTFRNYEVILLDDASQDGTQEILRQYADHPNVTVDLNTENSGSTFAQWIKGMRMAKGEVIWIAEDDDYCEYNLLEKLLPLFNDPDVKLAYAQSYAVDESDQRLYSYINHTNEFSPTRWQRPYVASAEEEVNAGLAITNTIPNASAVLFRPFDAGEWVKMATAMQLAGDWLFYLFAIQGGKVAFLPEHLNYHRRHKNTNIHKTQFSSRRFDEIARTQKFVMEQFKINPKTKQKMWMYTKRIWDSIHPGRQEDFEVEYKKSLD